MQGHNPFLLLPIKSAVCQQCNLQISCKSPVHQKKTQYAIEHRSKKMKMMFVFWEGGASGLLDRHGGACSFFPEGLFVADPPMGRLGDQIHHIWR
jgi:hypothetical protein